MNIFPVLTQEPLTDSEKSNMLEWAGWLEKTKLSQGYESLRTKILENPNRTGAFCAWGIYAWYKKQGGWKRDPMSTNRYTFVLNDYHNETIVPPVYVDDTGAFKMVPGAHMTIHHNLIQMNDTCGLTFKEIAVEIRHLVEHGDWTEDTRGWLELNGEF